LPYNYNTKISRVVSVSADLSKLKISREDKAFANGAPVRKRGKWKWLGFLGTPLLLAGAWFFNAQSRPQSVELATVAQAYPSQVVTILNATGRVSAQRKASVSTKATGRLEFLGVREGSVVKAGEIIARIENKDVTATQDQAQAGLRAAKANLEQGLAEMRDAQSNLTRSKDLAAKNFISSATLDTAEARFDKSKASVASLNGAIDVAQANVRATVVSVEQTLIRAPFDGVVLTKNANVGDIITPFSSAVDSKGAVVNMADMDTLEVEADVSETAISKIAVGMPVEIQLDAFSELRLAGKISRMVPTIDRSKATLLVKVEFVERDPRVLPDMSAKVAFLSRPLLGAERAPVVAISPTAVTKRDGKDVVFVVTDNKVKQTPVTLGEKIGDATRVSGVKPGDKVVQSPNEKLLDGATIVIAKK
jgi:HlyD family secretion protein